MPVISDGEIAGHARQAGLSGGNVAIAVAIALAESGGNTHAHNPVPPDNSYGLWQINMIGSLGPERRRQFGIAKNEDLFSPATNARAMAAISNRGNNWKAWTTYTRGTYLRFMARGNSASGSPSAPAPTEPTGSGNPLSSIVEFVQTIGQPGTWVRVGLFLGGGTLIYIGLIRLAGIGPIATKVGKSAVEFLPGGSKVLKAVKVVNR